MFNVVTKSGTNRIHGQVWDHVQSRLFHASDDLTKENPTDNSNQLGFSAQGPVLRDKLCYYAVTFQDLIQHLQAIGLTPTQGLAERGYNPDRTARPCIGQFEQYVRSGAVDVGEQFEYIDEWAEDAVFGDSVFLGSKEYGTAREGCVYGRAPGCVWRVDWEERYLRSWD